MSAERSTSEPLAALAKAENDDHAHEQRMASEIYGLIIASSVLAADTDDDIADVALSVLVTLVVYWLAEAYAHSLAAWRVHGRRSQVFRELRSGWPLVSASFVPLLAVVVTAWLGATVGIAQIVGMICATVLLFGSGWIAARENGLAGYRRLLSALLAASLGIVLIVLKSLLH